MALGRVFFEYFGLPCHSFHRLLHTHYHLSFGAGTIGQIVAGITSGHILTPSPVKLKLTIKLPVLSPRPNYTDRATAASLSAKLVPTFENRGCRMVSATDPHGRILAFLGLSRYYFLQVAPQLYSRSEWSPFQNHYFL
jgi:hypothetical protein